MKGFSIYNYKWIRESPRMQNLWHFFSNQQVQVPDVISMNEKNLLIEKMLQIYWRVLHEYLYSESIRKISAKVMFETVIEYMI